MIEDDLAFLCNVKKSCLFKLRRMNSNLVGWLQNRLRPSAKIEYFKYWSTFFHLILGKCIKIMIIVMHILKLLTNLKNRIFYKKCHITKPWWLSWLERQSHDNLTMLKVQGSNQDIACPFLGHQFSSKHNSAGQNFDRIESQTSIFGREFPWPSGLALGDGSTT